MNSNESPSVAGVWKAWEFIKVWGKWLQGSWLNFYSRCISRCWNRRVSLIMQKMGEVNVCRIWLERLWPSLTWIEDFWCKNVGLFGVLRAPTWFCLVLHGLPWSHLVLRGPTWSYFVQENHKNSIDSYFGSAELYNHFKFLNNLENLQRYGF